ncbi:MAG: hypothetical protein HZC37_12075 [Burkholderiales bacterium]|nr:hypothetical protein [Burkholderiales bacterium]
MSKRLFAVVTCAALAAASFGTLAQTPAPAAAASTPRIDQRQANQERRIDQGVASGQLTRRETRRLERQQGAVNRAENRARADGTVTAQERARLEHMQDHTSANIARQRHDAQRRPAASAPAK